MQNMLISPTDLFNMLMLAIFTAGMARIYGKSIELGNILDFIPIWAQKTFQNYPKMQIFLECPFCLSIWACIITSLCLHLGFSQVLAYISINSLILTLIKQ